MQLNIGDIVRFRIPKGEFMGGLDGRCRIDKFVPVGKPKGPGIPMFRAGDVIVYTTILKDDGSDSHSMRHQPHLVEFAPDGAPDSAFVPYIQFEKV
jgi:hypothetical protein